MYLLNPINLSCLVLKHKTVLEFTISLQGLFLANFVAVIGLYSQCQKVSFSQFLEENSHIRELRRKIIIFIMVKVDLKLSNIQHCTVSCNASCNGDYKLTLQLNSDKYNDGFYDLTLQLKALKNSQFLAFTR